MILDITTEEQEVLYEALMEHAADLVRKLDRLPVNSKSNALRVDRQTTLGLVVKLRTAR
jgi:hypothetical protein